MTNILALETSTDICSVSIRKGVDVFNFHESLPRQHTENLLSVISELLNESKLGFKDLDAIAVGVGPGSYTGVRLSCAVCLLYTSPSPRDATLSRMPSSA